MECPKCGGETTVLKTRQYEERVYRRRKCRDCGFRFTTDELRREEDKEGDGEQPPDDG